MLSREETEARLGFKVPEDYWNFIPWGNRILVRRFPEDEITSGGIIIPSNSKQLKSVGIIVRVGNTVGLVEDTGPVGVGNAILPDEFYGDDGEYGDDLVGLVVTFGEFAGSAVGDDRRNSYESEYTMIMAADIWGHNEGDSWPVSEE
jgi:co-chaperonin GroES (HSP10)